MARSVEFKEIRDVPAGTPVKMYGEDSDGLIITAALPYSTKASQRKNTASLPHEAEQVLTFDFGMDSFIIDRIFVYFGENATHGSILEAQFNIRVTEQDDCLAAANRAVIGSMYEWLAPREELENTLFAAADTDHNQTINVEYTSDRHLMKRLDVTAAGETTSAFEYVRVQYIPDSTHFEFETDVVNEYDTYDNVRECAEYFPTGAYWNTDGKLYVKIINLSGIGEERTFYVTAEITKLVSL